MKSRLVLHLFLVAGALLAISAGAYAGGGSLEPIATAAAAMFSVHACAGALTVVLVRDGAGRREPVRLTRLEASSLGG